MRDLVGANLVTLDSQEKVDVLKFQKKRRASS